MATCAIVQIDIPPKKVVKRWEKDDALVRYHEELIDLSKRSFINYAKHIGVDYHCYHTAIWPQYHPQVEIFRNTIDMQYDFILAVDIDVVANTKENIFPHCAPGKVSYVDRRPKEKDYWIRRAGKTVFNSGTVVFHRDVADTVNENLDLDKADRIDGRDQATLQDMFDDLGIGHRLPFRFNNYEKEDINGTFIHFKGGTKDSWYPDVRQELLAKNSSHW